MNGAGDDGWPPAWLDMSGYADTDPDDAVPPTALDSLHEALFGHQVPPLPDDAWEAALRTAVTADQGADLGVDDALHVGTGSEPADHMADVAWCHDPSAGNGPVHDPLADWHPYGVPDPELADDAHTEGDTSFFEGGHG
jgi:hypothetical protein